MYDEEMLLKEAIAAMRNAYTPYSNIKVGAALLAKSGKIYTGCNVENASYGLTICAERVAVCCANQNQEREFEAIVIVNSTGKVFPPCGACRQFMIEFSPSMKVLLASSEKIVERYILSDLLPSNFKLKD